MTALVAWGTVPVAALLGWPLARLAEDDPFAAVVCGLIVCLSFLVAWTEVGR